MLLTNLPRSSQGKEQYQLLKFDEQCFYSCSVFSILVVLKLMELLCTILSFFQYLTLFFRFLFIYSLTSTSNLFPIPLNFSYVLLFVVFLILQWLPNLLKCFNGFTDYSISWYVSTIKIWWSIECLHIFTGNCKFACMWIYVLHANIETLYKKSDGKSNYV